MGSDSDLPVMRAAAEILDEFNVPYEISVVSAHRTPERMYIYSKNAHSRGLKLIIAGAGGAAHLPGMVAAITHVPVIGVPVQSKAMSGIDSLYSIVQMPGGIPVATVAINGAKNAGLLAVQILATTDSVLNDKMVEYRQQMKHEVEEKANRLEKLGHKNYYEG